MFLFIIFFQFFSSVFSFTFYFFQVSFSKIFKVFFKVQNISSSCLKFLLNFNCQPVSQSFINFVPCVGVMCLVLGGVMLFKGFF